MNKFKFKKLSIILLSLTLLVGGLVGCKKKDDKDKELVDDSTPVEVTKLTSSTLENTRNFNGKVVANEEVMVIPKMFGTVQSVNVKLGDFVSEGQTLFVIEQDDMKNNVQQSEVGISLAEKGVQQAQNAVDSALINRVTVEKNASQAKIDLDRARTLFNEGAIPKSQLEQAELGFTSADSQLKTIDSQISQAKVGLTQAQDQLRQARLSHEQLLDNFNNTVVKAPISGIVTSLDAKRGQIVSNGQPAAMVADISKVYIEIEVIEDVVNNISNGQEVTLNIPAAFDKPVKSTIDYISSTADIANKLYSVKAYIDNTGNKARPGMSGDLTLNVDKLDNTLAIPRDSILKMDGKDFVYIVEDGKAVKKEIVVGADFGDYLEIKSGIKVGDNLIIKGQHYVDDGSLVKVVGGGK